MSDYIKRDDAERMVAGMKSADGLSAVKALGVIPSADVAPVVRCKNCEWRNWETNGCDRNPCVEPWFENDFCSYGERKDKEADK